MNKEIRGKKVILREQREEDAAFFSYWFNQPEIMFQCGFTDFTDEEKEKKTINVSHRSEDSIWFTITDTDGKIIGETGLLRMFPAWHQTDLSIIIPDPEMQDKGADILILGCTELPVAFDIIGRTALPTIDPTVVLARAAVSFAGAPLREMQK